MAASPDRRRPGDEPAGLYVHVPFCRRVCPYCDFAVTTDGEERRRRYVEGLLAEIELAAEPRFAFDTIYFGGGTPSRLEPDALARILDGLRRRYRVVDDAAIFLEANPEDVDATRLVAWRELGVGTLSLGVQSLDEAHLRFLGRAHGPEDARRAIRAAKAAGFATVSIDLIYGLPGQDRSDWRRGLDAALAEEPDHLSCYQLTVHEKTRFGRMKARGELVELDGDAQGALFRWTHAYLADRGYPGYEVSSFARAERHRSRHNRKYWTHAPYLGLGPSAHSFDGAARWWNHPRLGRWREAVERGERPVEGRERIGPREKALEMVLLGLRTTDGIDLDAVSAVAGVDVAARNRAWIERAVAEALLVAEGTRLRPTIAGLAVADGLAASFALDAAL